MRAMFVSTLIAAALAALIAFSWAPKSTEAALLKAQLEQRAPAYATELQDEVPELQALFLDYADDPLLITKARLALMRYPAMARPILVQYGAESEFMDVLREYGEHIVPPIHHLISNESLVLNLRKQTQDLLGSAIDAFQSLRGAQDADAGDDASSSPLTPEARGWYAVMFIKRDGHDFLGQFVLTADGQVSRVQSERLLESINAFFAGGIRNLETRVRRDEDVGLGDVGWAALDIAVGISAVKVLRLGRAATAGGRALHFTERNAALAANLLRGSAMGTRIAKYGAPAVLAYVAIQHPDVLNALFVEAADVLGVPQRALQVLGWTLVLLPMILIARLLLGPLAAVLVGISKGLRFTQGLFSRAVPASQR